MPIDKAQTGWKHDDHKVQREFERVYQKAGNLEQSTSSILSATGNTDGPNSDNPELALWALTVMLDNNIIDKEKVKQLLHFKSGKLLGDLIGKAPIKFDIKREEIEERLKTVPDADGAVILANALIDIIGINNLTSSEKSITWTNRNAFNLHGVNIATKYFHLVNDEEFPADNYYYGTDADGNKGYHPLSLGSNRLEVEFDYTALLSGNVIVGTLPSGKSIYKTVVDVIDPFDDCEIIIRNIDSGSGIFNLFPDAMLYPNRYFTMEDRVYTADKEFYIEKLSGVPTTGTAKAIIYYL